METPDAEALRREWAGRDCEHPASEPEYYLASPTGDEVCVQCGAVTKHGEPYSGPPPTVHYFRPSD